MDLARIQKNIQSLEGPIFSSVKYASLIPQNKQMENIRLVPNLLIVSGLINQKIGDGVVAEGQETCYPSSIVTLVNMD